MEVYAREYLKCPAKVGAGASSVIRKYSLHINETFEVHAKANRSTVAGERASDAHWKALFEA